MGARGAAYFILGYSAALLVGGDARPAARGELWAGGVVYVRDGASLRIAGSAANLRTHRLVSSLFNDVSKLGADAAGRSTTRRLDHVDPGWFGLCRGVIGADGGVASASKSVAFLGLVLG